MAVLTQKREKRCKQERLSCYRSLTFTVLSRRESEFKRSKCEGAMIDISEAGSKILIGTPLQPGDVLLWDDIHRPGTVHVATVRWSQKADTFYTAGMRLL
jgi:hypothetical protein